MIAYIGLGSNLGDKAGYINSALNAMANIDGIYLTKMSKMIESQPLGRKKQPNYFNCVAQIKTRLTPEKLLDKLQFIEQKLGRVRTGHTNSSRTIDLDILLYADKIIDQPKLMIPHQSMHLRNFVLDGICEIDSGVVHPVLKQTAGELKSRLNGYDFTIEADKPRLISIAGVVGVGKTTLARGLAVMLDGHLIEENYDSNPYLAKVYDGLEKYALKSELYFLNDSVSQLNNEKLQHEKIYVNDYIFEKAFVYANRWLSELDMEKYKTEFVKLQPKVTKASIVIHMKDDLNRCLERIKVRKRPYEQKIGLNFLENLQADYDKLLQDWANCPVITLDCKNFNAKDANSVRSLSQEIKHYI